MIFEIVQIEVTEGMEADFAAAVATAMPLFEASAGCRSLKLLRSIEQPSRFRLLVGWDSVDAHMTGFRQSPAFAEWRARVSPYFACPPQMEHVETVVAGFAGRP